MAVSKVLRWSRTPSGLGVSRQCQRVAMRADDIGDGDSWSAHTAPIRFPVTSKRRKTVAQRRQNELNTGT